MTKSKAKRDKHTELPDSGAEPPQGGTLESEAPALTMVRVVRTASAPKLSPGRSGGAITYQVGRIEGRGTSSVLIRLKDNEGGGQFSKEWVPFERIRACFPPAVLAGQPFKSSVVANAHLGKSSTNSGFLTAVLRAEGLAYEDGDHRGMSLLCGDFDAWTQGVLDAEPEKNDDGTVKQEPLVPPKRENPFTAAKGASAKKSGGGRNQPPADDAAAGTSDVASEDAGAAEAEPSAAEV